MTRKDKTPARGKSLDRAAESEDNEERRITRSRAASRTRGEDTSSGRLNLNTGKASSSHSDQQEIESNIRENQEQVDLTIPRSDISVVSGTVGKRNSRLAARMEGTETTPQSIADTINETIVHHVLANNRDKLKIEIFDGKAGQDLDRWIKEYKMRTRMAGWDDLAVRDGIPMYLGGKYKYWYEGRVVHVSEEKKKKYDTSEKVFEMMLDAELHDKENWLKKLKDLKQGDSPLNRYLQDLEMICNEINEDMNEQQRVEYAYEGINKELGMRIFEKRPKTIDEMRKYGKEVEAGYRKFMDDKEREIDELKKLKNELLHMKEKTEIESLANEMKRKPAQETEEMKKLIRSFAEVVSSSAANGHQPSHTDTARKDRDSERQGGGSNGFYRNANRNRSWNRNDNYQGARNWNDRSRNYGNEYRPSGNRMFRRDSSSDRNREQSREGREYSQERNERNNRGHWQPSSANRKFEGRFPHPTVRFAGGVNESSSTYTGPRNGGMTCYNCKKKGHIARNCPENNDSSRPSSSNGSRSAASSPRRPWDSRRNGHSIRMAHHDAPENKLTYVAVLVNGIKENAIMDTGADKCIMSSALAEKLRVVPDTEKCPRILAIDGQEIGIAGTANVELTYDLVKKPRKIALDVIVSIDDRDFFIVGNNFATETNAVIKTRERKVEFPPDTSLVSADQIKEYCTKTKKREAFVTKKQFDLLLEEYEKGKAEQANGQRKKFKWLIGQPETWTIDDFVKEFEVEEKEIETSELTFGAGTIKVGKFMTTEQRDSLSQLLEKYRSVFSFPGEPLGQCSLYLHQIDTNGSKPVHSQPYATSDKQREDIRRHVEEMLRDGVVRPSKSPWASSPHLVPKADGTTRMVVDYRALNKVTKRDSYPMPSIDLALSCLNGSKWFSTLDLLQGFFQILMSPESVEKTAFTTHDGLYEFTRLPFGLRNSPSTFQRIMDVILSDVKYSQVMVFLDDLLVFSESFEQHLERIENILKRLQDAGLTVKPSKVFLMLPGVKYLGHFVDESGVKMQKEKLEAIINYPQPRNVHDIKSFLGLAGYYRRFIRSFAALSEPLSRLTRKDLPFVWTGLQQASFNFLKRELLSFPVLCHYNSKLPIELHVDACGTGLGAVIGHRLEKEFHPIHYISRLLSDTEKRYSTTDQEALCIAYSIDKFKRYLVGIPFTIFTDHKALTWIKSKTKLPDRLHRFSLELQAYDYTIEYKPGRLNTDADALSRYAISPAEDTEANMPLLAMTATESGNYEWPESREKVKIEQKEDKLFGEIYRKVQSEENCPEKKKFFIEDELLFRRKKRKTGEKAALCVPLSMREFVLYHLHDDVMGGHLGVFKMLEKLRERFYFPKMEPFVRKYIASCQSCIFRKKERVKPAGLLKSIEVGRPFDLVAIDIWESPRRSAAGNKYVIVCSDYLTRYVEVLALPVASAEAVADFLINTIVANYGPPGKLLTDRGKNFMSRLCNAVYDMTSIKKIWTTPYKPSTDGLVEKYNHTMAEMLSHYVSIGMHDWDKWLQVLKFAYNSSKSPSTGYSPFYLLRGYEPRLLLDLTLELPTFMDPKHRDDDLYLTNFLASMNDARECAKKAIAHSQELSAKYHNRKRRDIKFMEGDLVLQYEHRSKKLTNRFTGPYRVSKVYPNNTVKLESISGKHYHAVVNIQDLKLFKERILYDSSSDESADGEIQNTNSENADSDSETSDCLEVENKVVKNPTKDGPVTRRMAKLINEKNEQKNISQTEKRELPNKGKVVKIAANFDRPLPRRSLRERKQNRKFPETLFALLATSFILPRMAETTFIRMNPIVWKQSEKPVVAGITQVFTSINYEQPCLVFNDSLTDKFKPYTEQYRQWCVEEFRDTWITQFKKFCKTPSAIPTYDNGRQRRDATAADSHNIEKRFITSAFLGSLLIGVFATVGFNTFSVLDTAKTKNEIQSLRIKHQHIMDAIHKYADNERKTQEILDKLENVVGEIGTNVKVLADKLGIISDSQAHSLTTISKMISTLQVIKSNLIDVGRDWHHGIFNHKLLDILNLELPCSDKCPPKYFRPQACEIDTMRNMITITFETKTIRSTASILVADPFKLFQRETNSSRICTKKYVGPTEAVYDKSTDCVTLIAQGNSMIDDLILSPSPDSCNNRKPLANSDRLFKTEECKDESEYDKFEYIQIKDLKTNNYVYCPTRNITVFNTTFRCPPYVFSLPSFTSFSIDQLHYHADQLKLHSTLNIIPENSARVNFHILPILPDLDFEPLLSKTKNETLNFVPVQYSDFLDISLDFISVFQSCIILILIAVVLTLALKAFPCDLNRFRYKRANVDPTCDKRRIRFSRTGSKSNVSMQSMVKSEEETGQDP